MADTTPTTPSQRSKDQNGPVITAAQKQQLLDNLSLEVTNKARKLRAQYSSMSSNLRARLEMRINRIPRELRSVTMEELIDRYAEDLEAPKKPPSQKLTAIYPPVITSLAPPHPYISQSPMRLKRSSAEMIGSDKENQSTQMSVQKKRKVEARKPVPANVLSPKSHNTSRTLANSPIKAMSSVSNPTKSANPAPSKTVRGRVATKTSTTSTVGTSRPGAKRAPAAATSTTQPASSQTSKSKRGRQSSSSSATSTTTVVNKKSTATKNTKGLMSKMKGMANTVGRKTTKKDAAAAAAAADPPVTRPRALRSRK